MYETKNIEEASTEVSDHYLAVQAQRRQSHLVNRCDATDSHGDRRREDRGAQVHHCFGLVIFSPFLSNKEEVNVSRDKGQTLSWAPTAQGKKPLQKWRHW